MRGDRPQCPSPPLTVPQSSPLGDRAVEFLKHPPPSLDYHNGKQFDCCLGDPHLFTHAGGPPGHDPTPVEDEGPESNGPTHVRPHGKASSTGTSRGQPEYHTSHTCSDGRYRGQRYLQRPTHRQPSSGIGSRLLHLVSVGNHLPQI